MRIASAAFVLGKYVILENVLLSLKWLQVRERREFSILKLTHKVLYNEVCPAFLLLELHSVEGYNLRSCSANQLSVPGLKEVDTFQHMATNTFNILPEYIRNTKLYAPFLKAAKKFLCTRQNRA